MVGAGSAGAAHVRALHGVPHAELVAVCDRDEARARAALGTRRAAVYRELGAMLAAERIDVLHVATPNADHGDAAAAAFARGAHVICEKPLEVALDRIDALSAGAARAGVRLAGVYQLRWLPAVRALRDELAAGALGTIAWAGAFVVWHRDAPYYATWRGDPRHAGGVAMTNAIHAVDLIQWLLGPVTAASAFAASRLHPDDTLAGALRLASGGVVTLGATTAASQGRPARLEIAGSLGTAAIEPPADTSALLAENFAAILSAWDAGRDAETSGPECRKSVEIVLALLASARSGNAIAIPA